MRTEKQIKAEIKKLDRQFKEIDLDDSGYGGVEDQASIGGQIAALEWVLNTDTLGARS